MGRGVGERKLRDLDKVLLRRKIYYVHKVVRKDLLAPKTDALVRPSLGDDARSDASASFPSFTMTDMYVFIMPRGSYVGGDWRFMVGGNLSLHPTRMDTQRMLKIVVFFFTRDFNRTYSIRLLNHLFAVLSCAVVFVLLSCPMIRGCIS